MLLFLVLYEKEDFLDSVEKHIIYFLVHFEFLSDTFFYLIRFSRTGARQVQRVRRNLAPRFERPRGLRKLPN